MITTVQQPNHDNIQTCTEVAALVVTSKPHHSKISPCGELLSKRRVRPHRDVMAICKHRRKCNATIGMLSILLLLLAFVHVTSAAFTAITTLHISSSRSYTNVHSPDGAPVVVHRARRQHPPCSPRDATLLLLQNTETEPMSKRRNTALTASSTTAADAAKTTYTIGNNNQKQPKSYGDKIYSRVKSLGKLLTFQASNPKNSAYFFGPTNNMMQHYYDNNVDPSRRIFQLADDVDSDNINNNNPRSSTETNTTTTTTDTIHESKPRFLGKRERRQTKQRPMNDGDNRSIDNDDTNIVFAKYGSSRKIQSFESPVGDERQVWEALASLEKDMSLLDRMIGTKPQLSNLQLLLLGSAVLSTASSPLFLAGQLTEFVAPSMAAFTAAIGIAAEYRGRVAVADSKEVAAASLQCAAEAEGYLAAAERAKAVRSIVWCIVRPRSLFFFHRYSNVSFPFHCRLHPCVWGSVQQLRHYPYWYQYWWTVFLSVRPMCNW